MSKRIKKISIIFIVSIITFIVFIFVAYHIHKNEIKRKIINKIAIRSSEFLGHNVEIKNLTFSTSEGINFYDISVKNPPGFKFDNLLFIKKLHIKLELKELIAGRFFSENITVTSPELILYKDKNGRLNLSDKILSLFKRESKLIYRINELKIKSGYFKFYLNSANEYSKAYRNLQEIKIIELDLNNLSSMKGEKTFINGKADYAGGRLGIKGWAYLKDSPKKFMISANLEDMPLSVFDEIFSKYNVRLEKATLKTGVLIEGTSDIVNIKNTLQINNIFSHYISRKINKINVENECSYIINKDTISINSLKINSDNLLSINAQAIIKDITKSPEYKIGLTINKFDFYALEFPDDYKVSGFLRNSTIDIYGNSFKKIPKFNLNADLKNISVIRGGKNLINKANIDLNINSDETNTLFKVMSSAGKFKIKATGIAKNIATHNSFINFKVEIPNVKAIDLRDAFWDIFPDNLLYAGMDGFLSSDFSINYTAQSFNVSGLLKVNGLIIEGENGEFTIGPINGVLPISYQKNNTNITLSKKESGANIFSKIPMFEKEEFSNLKKFYTTQEMCKNCNKITIGDISYGMPLLKNINIFIERGENIYNIPLFSADISGGKLKGTAFLNISNGIDYTAGFIIEKLSLKEFCEGFEPIKGYISGLVDGLVFIKSSGTSINNLIGRAELWTYSSKKEKTKISKNFLKKVGGPTLKTYLGDRSFDKGIVSMYFKNGYIIFKELEISNKNILGIKDLTVKVAPFNNRISIEHLLWTITEAAHRAKNIDAEKNK